MGAGLAVLEQTAALPGETRSSTRAKAWFNAAQKDIAPACRRDLPPKKLVHLKS